MITIKRYANRKLYDTQAGCYITIDEIGQAVRQGEDVRVVDHATGADLTTLTLLQIILEEERKAHGWLPHQVLERLLRAGETRLKVICDFLGGSVNRRETVDEIIRRRLGLLVQQGSLEETEASRVLEMLLATELSEDELISAEPAEPATSAEIQTLRGDIERLEIAFDELLDGL